MKKLFIGIIVFSALVFFVLSGVNPFLKNNEVQASIDSGQKVYQKLCLSCHGENGKGEGALIGTSLNNQHYLSTFSDEDIYIAIEDGKAVAMMPEYRFLKEEEKEDLVSFIRSWQTKPLKLEAPSVIKGNATNGKKLYKAFCTTCHGETGSGLLTTAAAIAHPNTIKNMTDKQMWMTVAYGREETRMGPSLKGLDGVRQLEEQELSDIVVYIRNELTNRFDPLEYRNKHVKHNESLKRDENTNQ